ncbi:MAG TPA: NAD(P)/FAD-dependent oxidoreductase [Pseudolabrys sp.]|jgi:NADH dehydrogenase|nr:NAD(P)/FAD-dependent oxidoreductase [Pseudolabrys sp.]
MANGKVKVVIVGAGFGGLEAAKALRRAAAEVVVIDRHNHHCFQPLLYQVATAALSPADIAWPIRHILRFQRNATVLMEKVLGIDAKERLVRAEFGEVRYDYLVIAAGAQHSYFGRDEWAAYAPGLKRIEDATTIRRKILTAFERAELTQDDNEQQRLITFVIVGGGATGVEMAGAIADVARQTLAADFRRIDPRRARIVLIEAGTRVLPTFSPHLSDYVRKTLERSGVEVRTETLVTDCDAQGVDLKNGRIDAETIIWAAGVTASPAAQWLGAETDASGRVKVAKDLSVPDNPNIFVIGDTASVLDEQGRPVPGIAPAAKQMGKYVAKVISARIAGSKQPGPFRYVHFGDLATIGRRAAVVKLGRLELKGFVAWAFWSVAHIYFLIGLRYRFLVAINWAWDYITFQRGARLITEDRSPKDR